MNTDTRVEGGPKPGHQYDPVAEDYDRLIRPRYEAIASLVVGRARRLLDLPTADVVELSAGTGALTRQLAPLTRRYVATDVSETMLAIARRHDAGGPAQVSYLPGDVRHLPFEPAAADLVVSSLGPVQELPDGLAETWRVLRPGGALVGVTWGDDYRELDLVQDLQRRLDLPPRPTTSAADLAQRLEDAGFREVAVGQVRMPVVHDSVVAYVAYRRAFGLVGDLGTRTPEEIHRALVAATSPYADDEGRVVLDWHLLVFSGRR